MSWMAWTPQTAGFFIAIATGIVLMTVFELVRPTTTRRGFLPIATTRGDRFFISLLAAAFIHLAWLALTTGAIWPASLIALVTAIGLMRWG